jgi:hypothetical protein
MALLEYTPPPLGAIGVTKPGALFVATGQGQRSGQREPEK